MADQQQLELLRQGIDAWNTWRAQHPTIYPDLREASLSEANLSTVNLSAVNLSSAYLNAASLNAANLSTANLSAAYLYRAELIGANLNGALQLHFVGGRVFSSQFGVRLRS